MKKVLFICSQNKWRSPTAEQVFAEHPGVEVDSAGLNHDAIVPLSSEQVIWADIIFVMEKVQKVKLAQRFRKVLKGQKIVCLDIPDVYEFIDEDLVDLLRKKVPGHLG